MQRRVDAPRLGRLRLLLAGLAAGDGLGATTEFCAQRDVPDVWRRVRAQGWPYRQAGGGALGLSPGETTDDTAMAMCMARSFVALGRFDADDVARRFVAWMRTRPPDIGGTTVRTLSAVAAGAPWHEGGLAEFRRRPENAANGSLMRNGIVPALARDLDEAFTITLHHGIITHYAPLPVLCCAAQTWLIAELLEGRRPLEDDWRPAFRRRFTRWLDTTGDSVSRRWGANVSDRLREAWRRLDAAEFNADRFDPFAISYAGRAGYALLTLQIAVWAAAWSLREGPLTTPCGFPDEAFARNGPYALGWVALIGEDSDTYGATAGPLIAAAHGELPGDLTAGLAALDEFDRLTGGENS